MQRSAILAILLSLSINHRPCFSQGEAALPFLLISPYAEANGMGSASVAGHTSDPLAVTTNPAHLGMMSRMQYFSFGYNSSDWLPIFYQSDLRFTTWAVNAGVNLEKINPDALPLSFGLGYSRVHLNLGTFIRTGPGGPQPLETYTAWESSDQFSVAAAADFWVRASVGLTFKHVVSNLGPTPTEMEMGRTGRARANLYDFGFLIDVPVAHIVANIADNDFSLAPNLTPFLDWSLGISKSNFGQESITYFATSMANPLPRYAQAGIGLHLGLVYDNDDEEWKPLSFKWTIEAADVLVDPATGGYQSGLGDIRFFDEVFGGNTNKETEKRKGWEFTVMEIISVRGGRFEEDMDRGGRRFDSSGWGIRFAGIVKLLRALDVRMDEDTMGGFLLRHIDIRYDHSSWDTDGPSAPLFGTTFDAVSIGVIN